MKIRFDNVDLNSSSGPNNFANRLMKRLLLDGHQVSFDDSSSDVQLSFIQSISRHDNIVHRLDGIYFNSEQDWKALNRPIKSTFDASAAVIYQSEFNKTLTEKYFGHHANSHVINNGADIDVISNIEPISHEVLNEYDSVWSCASSWRPHKRLKENIRYFLEHSNNKTCLVVAGKNPDTAVHNERVFYTGELDWLNLIALYKRSERFIHLALLDHCPNVVVEARAAGCHIVCTDSGGTKEVAGLDATVIKDMEWDFKPFELYKPIDLDFSSTSKNSYASELCMSSVATNYLNVFRSI